jgi:hypothetical protein
VTSSCFEENHETAFSSAPSSDYLQFLRHSMLCLTSCFTCHSIWEFPYELRWQHQLQAMSSSAANDVELGHSVTSYLSKSMSAEEILDLNYGKRLARQFLSPKQTADQNDKILTFRKLRRYNIARIQHDVLKLFHRLKTVDGGTEDERMKLSSLLHEHGIHP